MALTLLEAAKLHSGDVMRAAAIEIYAGSSDILKVLPFESISGNALKYNREDTLPGIGFRGVNEAYTASTGILNPITETLAIAGGDLDVDKFILKTMGQDQRAVQEAMKIKALGLCWTKKFLKGDQTSDPREFDGLQARVAGSNVIDQGSTSGGDVLTLAKLDEMIDRVENPTHLIMNKTFRRRFIAAARTTTVGGYVQFEKDAMGVPVMSYAGLPILTVDLDEAGSAILPFTEAAASGTAQCSSIYCISLGDGKLMGLQNGAPEVTDLGELQTQPAVRTRLEWYAGMAVFHSRAAARLRYVKDGAITA